MARSLRTILAFVFIACWLMVLSTMSVGAQQSQAYRIQPGDVLSIVVYGEGDLSRDVPVLLDGTISFPFLDHHRVEGLSLAEVEAILTDHLSAVVKVPVVSVSVKPAKGPFVILLGEVASPGILPLLGGETDLLEVIARAGGATPAADLARVRVYDGGNIRNFIDAPIGVDGVLFEGDTLLNPTIGPGNIIYVPPTDAENQVFVLGEVRSPGAYAIEPGRDARVLDIIARAGGTTAAADLAKVKVYERGDVTDFRQAPIGAAGMLFEGEDVNNLQVAVGNIIYVPPTDAENQVFVLGEVRSPGAYAIEPGRDARVLDIIARAGGTTAAADLAKVKVYERGDVTDFRQAPIGAAGMLFEGGEVNNLQVAVGNIIYVPPTDAENQVFVLGEVRSPGAYAIEPGRDARVLDIIARAGGTTAAADLAKVKVYERGDVSDFRQAPIGAAGMLFEGGEVNNLQVSVGNIIYVPPTDAENQVFVLGEVRSPGAYAIEPGRDARVLDIIARAGGTTAAADLAKVKVYERGDVTDFRQAPIGAAGMLFEGGEVNNIQVSVGNIIYVPPTDAENQVFVLGEVRSPGAYAIEPGRDARVLDIIARAGGTTAAADLAKVKVYESGDVSDFRQAPIGAAGMLFEGGEVNNLQVAVGNIIYVPPTDAENQVFVLGEVRSPGAYAIEPGHDARVLDIIARAGGTTAAADLAKVKVYERGDVSDFRQAPIGAAGMLFEGGEVNNLQVAVGNIIYVPPTDAENQVFVLGEVRSPGAYAIEPGRDARVLDMIARAGGTTPAADLAQVKVYERGNVSDFRQAPIGAAGMLFEGGEVHNLQVSVGNIIYVPPGVIDVMIMGPVARPGTYQVGARDRVLKLLGEAGGLLPQADPTHLLLRREMNTGEVVHLPIDLDKVLSGEANDQNYMLQPGDLLVIQPMIQIAVAGEVKTNGVFQLKSRARVTDAILAAGGVTDRADLNNMSITRTADGEHLIIPVDFEAILSGQGENVAVRDGDIINVSRTERVAFVGGEVAHPGSFAVTQTTRLVDLIFAAGGPTRLADEQLITIYDASGAIVFTGSLAQNPAVSPGQTVMVPRATMDILVVGDAEKTGLIEVPNRSRILDVVAMIGGPDTSGNWTRVQVVREVDGVAETHLVDVPSLLQSPDPSQNIALYPGDLVYVPSNTARVSIVGEVARPGTYALNQDARLVDALAAAGGAAQNASLERVNVMPSGEILIPMEVSLGRHNQLLPDQIDENMIMSDGDVIVVPKSNRITWQDVVTFLTGVKLLKDLLD